MEGGGTWLVPFSSYEIVHTNVCKYSLNMSKCGSNDTCLGELGRYSIINMISFTALNIGGDWNRVWKIIL